MRRIKRILIVVIMIIFGILNFNIVYADPNSSKGFAEYSDEISEENNKKLEEEQNKHTTGGKSTNNYLESLKVEGYSISPAFEKQTLEYNIIQKVSVEEIIIVANATDSRAKVEGIGKVKLNYGQNKCRVDVIAESGTVRTYIINAERIEKNNNRQNNGVRENNETNNETFVENNEAVEENESLKMSDSKNVNYRNIIIISIIILGIIIILIKLKKK